MSGFGSFSMASPRHENQDAWIALDGEAASGILLAVCDGVSSTDLGGHAAELLAENLGAVYKRPGKLGLEDLWNCIIETDWELAGMGRGKAACTMTLVWITGAEALILTVGDSPVLMCREGDCQQLTHAKGRGGLSGFVGMGKGLEEKIDQCRMPLEPGDVLFVTTDGVSGSLSPREFASCWEEVPEPQPCAQRLVRTAREAGSDDDITAIVLLYQPGDVQ